MLVPKGTNMFQKAHSPHVYHTDSMKAKRDTLLDLGPITTFESALLRWAWQYPWLANVPITDAPGQNDSTEPTS